MPPVRFDPVRAAARASRRFYYRLRARGIPVVYDARYQRGMYGVPLDPLRGDKVLGALEEAGLLAADLLFEPRPASLQNLLRVHTPEYLDSVQEPETLGRILGMEIPAREVESTLDLQRLMTGGTIQASRLALRTGGVAVHLGGGLHHALADAGLGFCVFNDIAVAIRRLRARGFTDPVLVVDLDLHDGNGTRRLFADDATVHTLSIHNEHWGATEAVASTSIALGAGVDDARYLGTLRETLPPIVASVRPGLVVYVAGTDPAADDAIGNWRVSPAGLLERDRLVTSLVRPAGAACPMVVVLAGGYGRHAWRYTARYLLWLASGRELEPAAEEALTLKRFRRLNSDLSYAETVDDGLPFSLSEEDIAGLMPGGARPARFLGYFSRHGVELLLERSGVLAQLRAKGFRSLAVELDSRQAQEQTLRVVCHEARRELLVELRAQRSRSAVPGMDLIAVEWLLLQNPREPFSARRPRLPGQQHPGLGLLRDFMGWLMVVCEAHALDGVFFVAAHYHVAMQSRRLVSPLRPEDEARLAALSRALAGLSLPEATEAIEAGGVVDAVSGARVEWKPVATVLPVSDRMRALVSGPEYEDVVRREADRFSFRLLPTRPDSVRAPARRGSK
jgi:acetoin utilization deacetylase AcuC-like enzyme